MTQPTSQPARAQRTMLLMLIAHRPQPHVMMQYTTILSTSAVPGDFSPVRHVTCVVARQRRGPCDVLLSPFHCRRATRIRSTRRLYRIIVAQTRMHDVGLACGFRGMEFSPGVQDLRIAIVHSQFSAQPHQSVRRVQAGSAARVYFQYCEASPSPRAFGVLCLTNVAAQQLANASVPVSIHQPPSMNVKARRRSELLWCMLG